MKKLITIIVVFFTIISGSALGEDQSHNPYWGDGTQFFETRQLYAEGRSPNVVIAMDGTIVTSWGQEQAPGSPQRRWRRNMGAGHRCIPL